MRRATLVFSLALAGMAAAGVAGFALRSASPARADSIAPDLSGLQAQLASALAQIGTATSAATTAQQAATTSANAAQVAQTAASSVSSDFGGTFTRAAGLPSATALDGKRIWVTDLGGGAGELRAVAGCWVRTGSPLNAKPQSVPVAGTIALDGYANSPNVVLTGSAMATKATIAMTNACAMPGLTLSYPTGVFSATGALAIAGLNANAPAVSVGGVGVTASFGVFALLADGSNYQRTMGPTLP